MTRLTRNVNDAHLKEIFSNYGTVQKAEVQLDPKIKLPMGFAFVEYKTKTEAENAIKFMDKGHVDGAEISVRLLESSAPRRRDPSPRGRRSTSFLQCCAWRCVI